MNAQRALTRDWLLPSVEARSREASAPAPSRVEVDDGTFSQWVSEHYECVYRFLLTRTQNEDDARDLTQDTFLKAYRARGRFQADKPVRNWLLTIAANCRRDFLRRQNRTSFIAQPELEDCIQNAAAPAAEADYLACELQHALPQLTEEQRIVLHLRVAEQQSFREIADSLGCSEAAAKMRVQRAKHRLAKLIGRDLISDE